MALHKPGGFCALFCGLLRPLLVLPSKPLFLPVPGKIVFGKLRVLLCGGVEMIIRRRFLIPGLGPAGRPCRMLPDFALYKPGAMPQDNLPGKLRTVGPFRSYIFLLHLVELAMHKAVNAPSGGPRRLTDRAFLFGRLLLCQLFPGGLPFFAPLFHAELGCRRLFLLAFLPEF